MNRSKIPLRRRSRSRSPSCTCHGEAVLKESEDGGTRNRRTVWSINTSPTNGNHIASFPEDLVEPCILASTKPGDFVFDPFFGCGFLWLELPQSRAEVRHGWVQTRFFEDFWSAKCATFSARDLEPFSELSSALFHSAADIE